jgi:hypothetical protein
MDPFVIVYGYIVMMKVELELRAELSSCTVLDEILELYAQHSAVVVEKAILMLGAPTSEPRYIQS